jgi:hypothetical protein
MLRGVGEYSPTVLPLSLGGGAGGDVSPSGVWS